MTDFLNSLKADLLDRRVRPILVLVSVALVGALAYALLGGGSGTSSPSPGSTTPAAPLDTGVAVKATPTSASQPVAETTSGAALQRGGVTRNPFKSLPQPAAKSPSSAAKSPSSASKGASSSGGSSSSASQSAGESTKSSPTPSSKPTSPKKSKTIYRVAVQFGSVPAGTPTASAQLTPYDNLTREEPLPTSKQPIVVFRGVTSGGKSATFTLVGEVILRGVAQCLPSPSQCTAIALEPGQSEELEYAPAGAPAIVYVLQLVAINSSRATGARARAAFSRESKAGRRLLGRIGLTALPGLRYSSANGVLVLVPHRSRSARAHHAARRARAKR